MTKPDQKLPRTKRLNQRADFLRFFQGSESVASPHFIVFRIACPPGEPVKRRLGITIKCRCTSVSRMKVKRVVREWFRTRDESFDGYDYNVVIPATVKVCFPYWEQLKEGLSKVKTNDFRIRTRSQARR